MGKRALRLVMLVNAGVAAVLLGACRGNTTVNDDGYDTSCLTDGDCVAVYFGDVCGFCATVSPNAAISSSADGAYQNAVNAAQRNCPPNNEQGSCAESDSITTCSMGKCTLDTCSGWPASPHSCSSDAGPD